MKNQEQEKVYDEKKGQEETREKRSYQPPELQRLGNLQDLTKGLPGPIPDFAGLSL